MDAQGAFVLGGALDGPEAAQVAQLTDGGTVVVDGPFADSSSHIGGSYIISAEDLDAALGWATKVARATNHSIEVRPFRATGRIAEQMKGTP